jgi:hypothetical protein
MKKITFRPSLRSSCHQTARKMSWTCGRFVNEQIHNFRGPCAAAGDEGEAADQEISSAGLVQRAADPGEVFDLRLACVRAIVRVIHASASSKLSKRSTPRGTRAPVARTALSVR